MAATCTSEQEEYKRNFKRTGQATLECASNVLQAMFLVWILYRFMVFKQEIAAGFQNSLQVSLSKSYICVSFHA